MTESLKCPDCSAPLDFPSHGEGSMRCPYCNSTVIVPGNYQSAGGERSAPPHDAAMQFAGVVRALQAGNKIEAIRIYRQIHGVDLMTAKNAVEKYAFRAQIGAAATPMYALPGAAGSGAYAAKVGFGIAAGIIILVGAILTFTFVAMHRQMAKVKPALARTPSFVSPTIKPPVIRLKPPEPTFAHLAMEFGSEGIGAGRFTDARSITNDGQRHLFVGEYSDGRVQVFDAKGKFIVRWSIPKGTSLLNLTADRKGTVYAVVPSHIYRYEGLTGKLLGEVDNTTANGESFDYSDAYAALDGELYAIGGEHTVVDIDADGRIKRTVDLNEKVGEPVSFHRITVNGAGEMYLVEENKGIFKFAPDGRYINRFGGAHGRSPGAGRLSWPHAVATDGKGRVFVADNYRTVQVFDGEGSYLESLGDNEISFCLSITDQDEVYVVARNRCSVRKYVLEKP